mgnify:CR=1 FL=1
MAVQEITEETFAQAVQDNTLAFFDFYATWCGPCRMLAPVLDEVAAENAAVKVYKVDIDQSPDVAARYGVTSVPTLVVFVDGQVVNQTVGAQPKQNILALLNA